MQQHAIAVLSVTPLRAAASHPSEQVSQLLFGETATIIERKREWFKVRADYDGYEGWVQRFQVREIADKEYEQAQQNIGVALEIASTATSSEDTIPLVLGSSLPQFDGLNFRLCKEKFIYNGQALTSEQQPNTQLLIEKIALKYMNAPYLWGGRSPFGIDCSGFVQVVFKCLGIVLKRDAHQQAEQGVVVDFVQAAQLGDLAFFHNDEGRIIHVGIVLKDQKIIHASGKVRIDKLDHFGIYNTERKKYSHQLKIIKRIF